MFYGPRIQTPAPRIYGTAVISNEANAMRQSSTDFINSGQNHLVRVLWIALLSSFAALALAVVGG